VTQEAPITTHTGYQIISTFNSQVVIQGTDGMVSTVDAEVVGGKVNADKTISVKTASGDMTTLPSTGEKENFLMSLTGLGLLAMVGYYLKKRIRQA
jgi:LPXTG-motif cell wall-anchored protein